MVCVQHDFLFIELCFEYFLGCSEIYISDGVVFFGTLVRGVEAEITAMILHLSLGEELELGGFIFFLCF